MNFGQLTIFIAFISSLAGAFLFYFEGKNIFKPKSEKRNSLSVSSYAVRLYWTNVVSGVAASATLLYLLLSHQFQYAYVSQYSSLAQPFMYLISAFWAGQEGTFLLWALFVTLMGIVLLQKENSDKSALSVVNGFLAFLYFIMLVKSPFELSTEILSDGKGMNPLLQDPWMAIHPPLLFLGYAATLFPFAFVVSALLRKNYEQWNSLGYSWTLFATLALGAGIIIGGFWAYEVLGWGGYWGWDPVENSSLVPWMTLLALVHGFVVQKAKNSLARTNIFLAIISFILVFYATFLTRSGVLADFSVHSFVDLGINNYLIGGMLASIVLGLGLYFKRFPEIQSPKIDSSNFNREVSLLLSIIIICAGALFTFVGMSSPILTKLVGTASQVETSFYNKVNLPVALVIALLLGLTPFLSWTEERLQLLKKYSLPLLLTALATVIAYVAGVTSAILLLFVALSVFALISNAIIMFRQYRSGWMNLGGPIAHIGVALMFLGIIGSGNFDEKVQLSLHENETKNALGFQFTFKGITEQNSLKPKVNLEVSDGKTSFLATPKLYFSEYNQATMREPSIKIFPLNDLYISPLELKTQRSEHTFPLLEIVKGDSLQLEGYRIIFERFETGQHTEPGTMNVGALLKVVAQGKEYEIVPRISMNERGEQQSIPAELPAFQFPTKGIAKPQLSLERMSVEQKKIVLGLHGFDEHSDAGSEQTLFVEINTKPLMMVLWTGVVLLLSGTLIAWRRNEKENNASR
jgi:cytochrome c-type biogenesis protein CcmF